ncbi:integrator complex subunit 11 [Aplysia californica]|uniref:Integrator complex subunit 11 n=1 Tax=Aplysia californica TaxID=6500 RepID=A0ABM1W2U0_APLCA|nr:integrator complex subunit 11 [Aplysia californica]
MTDIKVTPLGAGQDVGRSCILLSIGGKNVMLDCGMHMGYNDDRRFPDFTYVAREGRLTDRINCLIISHFHLDHCGALPYMTEMVGYDGPIYMTHPTKAICPILLEDYRKINVERKGDTNFFTSEMIKACMKKVVTVNLHQVIQVDEELEIKAYYAGHVLGAAMFQIRVGQNSVVYTGDYNMTPDRHLGAAWVDKCRPDLLITESTYATTIRDSKRCRERDFLRKVHDCVEKGGKPFDRAYIENPGPMVVFATPGMLHAGLSLQIFKRWAPSEANMVIMPGYCVAGTVGHRILNGARKIELENKQTGIMQLISHCQPRNVLLVHGEAEKMAFLKNKIQEEFGIDCFMPANGETSVIKTRHNIPLDTALNLLKRQLLPAEAENSAQGALLMKGSHMQLTEPAAAFRELGVEEHELRFTCNIQLEEEGRVADTSERIYRVLQR